MTCQIFVILAHKHLQPNCAQGQGFICHLTDYIQNNPSQIAQSQMALYAICELWWIVSLMSCSVILVYKVRGFLLISFRSLVLFIFTVSLFDTFEIRVFEYPHTCLSFCLFCVLWLIIFSHRLFLHQVSTNFIKSGEFTLERMGVVYKAKAHLKSPFDPENKRVKGIYDWEQTTHVKTDEKHTSYRTAPELEGFTTFCTSSCFCFLSNTSSSQMLLIFFWFDGTHERMIDFMLICKMLHVESWWKM